MATINDYLRITIGDLKRMGYLKPDCIYTGGNLVWKQSGEPLSEMYVSTNTATGGEPSARFVYKFRNQWKEYRVQLKFVPSNLNTQAGNGYYYFVCPITGNCCRNLYLVGGCWMSREAFRPLYEAQALSRKQRANITPWDMLLLTEQLIKQLRQTSRYRRETYNGKITPYGRKMEKLRTKYAQLLQMQN